MSTRGRGSRLPSSDTSRCRSRSRRHGRPERPPPGRRMASRERQARCQRPTGVVRRIEGTDSILIGGTWRTLEFCTKCRSASVKGGGEHSWCLNPTCGRSKAKKETDWAHGGKKWLRRENKQKSKRQATMRIIQIHENLGQDAASSADAEGAGTSNSMGQEVIMKKLEDLLCMAPGNTSSVEPLAKRMPQRPDWSHLS